MSDRSRRPLAVILHDAVAPEAPADQQDTLVQAAEVGAALEALGYRTRRVALDADPAATVRRLKALAPALVFNLVESVASQGRFCHLVPALLDLAGLAYTGAGPTAALTTTDKLVTKRLLASAGLPTPAWIEPGALLAGTAPCGERYIVKSVAEDASIGIGPDSIADSPKALAAIARDRLGRLGGTWFAERYVEGREFNVALLGQAKAASVEVLPIAEMLFVGFGEGRPRIVDYAAKWDEASFEYRNTQRSFDFDPADAGLLSRMETAARRCWDLFGLRGYARVDFRVDAEGNPWILEVNINPCLASDAGFAAAAARRGLDLRAVVARVLADLPAPMTAAAPLGQNRPAQTNVPISDSVHVSHSSRS